jgi:flagellar hook assembly protein FlgD
MKTVKLLFLLLSFFVTMLKAQTICVKGNVSTATEPVKNACIRFTGVNDTTQNYTTITDSSGNYSIGLITSIEEKASSVPAKFELAQNYPNPFANETAISYNLNEQSNVHVTIYDILGREVRKYSIGKQPIGIHGLIWDGRNSFGEKVTAGIYLYRLQAGKESRVNKMVLTGGNGLSSNLTLSNNFTSSVKLNKETAVKINSENYTVRIANIDSTVPRIAAMVTKNILIGQDTTINFKVNKAPIAYAGEDCKVKVGQYVVLDGTKSRLGDGSILRYHWSADTTNPAEVSILWAEPQIYLGFVQQGIYKFFLEINDGIADSEPDTVIIEVNQREESKFEDPVMEIQVRYALKDPTEELTDEKLESIIRMTSTGMFGRVTSLKGIENCSNITELYFGLNSITDLTPLSRLTKLEKLALDQNYVLTDISPLANLTNLTELNLESNNITDISPLKNLTKLTTLSMIGNPIADISALENIKDLIDLSIGQYDRNCVQVSGLSVIEGFTKLEMLWLTCCEITNITFVKTLTNLQYLRISNHKVSDIQDVSNCTQLIRLYLDLNEITDIGPLEGLSNINLLDLKYNQITNIEPLVKNIGLGQGDAVSLIGNPLDDISINQYIPELKNRGVTVFY